MGFQIEFEDQDFVRIFRLEGELDNRSAQELQRELLAARSDGMSYLLLDLKELETITGAGIRVMVMVGERLEAEGGTLLLSSARPEVRRVFEIAGMKRQLTLEPSQASALRTLRQERRKAQTVELAGEILSRSGEGRKRRKAPDRPARAARRSSFAVDLLSDEDEPGS